MVIALSFIICHLSFTTAEAQTFTQRLQKSGKGEGVVTIHQSRDIDELVNGPKQERPATTTQQSAAGNAGKKPTAESDTKHDAKHSGARPEETKETVKDTVSVVHTGRPHKVIGYRVQAFAGGSSRDDRHKAERTANTIKQLFPSESVYTQYDNPRWTCRVGNYRTREEAKAMLAEIRKLGFTSANIIKARVVVYD